MTEYTDYNDPLFNALGVISNAEMVFNGLASPCCGSTRARCRCDSRAANCGTHDDAETEDAADDTDETAG